MKKTIKKTTSPWMVPGGLLLMAGASVALLAGCGGDEAQSQGGEPESQVQSSDPVGQPSPYYGKPTDGSKSMDELLAESKALRENRGVPAGRLLPAMTPPLHFAPGKAPAA